MKVRRNVNRYNLQFMNQALAIIASVTMVCYIMYTVSDEVIERMHTSYLYVTSIFVLAGIMRYFRCKKWESNQNINERLIYTNMYP